MSNYAFMRSGMSIVHERREQCRDDGLDPEQVRLMRAILLSFAEDATKMAALYTRGCGRHASIDAETMVRCLKARAMAGVSLDGDGDFPTRVHAYVGRLGARGGWLCSTQQHRALNRGVLHDCSTELATMSTARSIVALVDRLSVAYESWRPDDFVHKSIKIGIDRAGVRMAENTRKASHQ
jgi:hypothetical protein